MTTSSPAIEDSGACWDETVAVEGAQPDVRDWCRGLSHSCESVETCPDRLLHNLNLSLCNRSNNWTCKADYNSRQRPNR